MSWPESLQCSSSILRTLFKAHSSVISLVSHWFCNRIFPLISKPALTSIWQTIHERSERLLKSGDRFSILHKKTNRSKFKCLGLSSHKQVLMFPLNQYSSCGFVGCFVVVSVCFLNKFVKREDEKMNFAGSKFNCCLRK